MAPRHGRMRERRGRGTRGPLALPGQLAPVGPPPRPTRRELFDTLVLRAVAQLRAGWSERLDRLEICVEDVPDLGPTWSAEPTVPFVRVVGETRVVIYRMPMVTRLPLGGQLADLLMDELVAELAVLWQVDPDEVDPRG